MDAEHDVQMIEALNCILATLESTQTTLMEAFDAFDSNGSGSISISEFSSLMRTLGGLGLTRRQIYHLGQCMDENFDRSVGFNEFMQFFLVLWTTRLSSLKIELKEQMNINKEISHTIKKRIKKLQTMIAKTEKAIRMTFGAGFAEAAKRAKASLPGPFSTLMRGMQMGKYSVQNTLLDLEKVFGRVAPCAAKEMELQHRERKGEAARATEAAMANRGTTRQLSSNHTRDPVTVPSIFTTLPKAPPSKKSKLKKGVIPGRNQLKRIKMAKELRKLHQVHGAPTRKFVHGQEVSGHLSSSPLLHSLFES